MKEVAKYEAATSVSAAHTFEFQGKKQVALATSHLTGPDWSGDVRIVDFGTEKSSSSSSSASLAVSPLQTISQAQLIRNVGVSDVAVRVEGDKAMVLAAADDGKLVGWFFTHASQSFPNTVWGVNAHSSRVSSVHLSSVQTNRLLTSSWTGEVKFWDLSESLSPSSDIVAPLSVSSFSCLSSFPFPFLPQET